MESFLHAVTSVTIILLLTATGYFCAVRGWMSPQAKRFISRFTMSVAVPCMCVYGLTNNLTHELLAESPGFLLVPFLSTVGAFLLSLLVGMLLKLPRRRLGVFMMMCSVSNAIFIGLPMCTGRLHLAAGGYGRDLHALCDALLPCQHKLCSARGSLARALGRRERRL